MLKIIINIRIHIFVSFFWVSSLMGQGWMVKPSKPVGTFMVNQPGFNGKSIIKPAFEPTVKSERLKIYEENQLIKIDGGLIDEAWTAAELVQGFVDKKQNEMVEDQTSIKVFYDKKHIYFYIICNESRMESISNSCEIHDSPVVLDPHLGIYITPLKSEDIKHFYEGYYYYIAVNSTGAVFDAFYNPWHGGIFYPNWNPDIRIKTRQFSDKWIIEMSIAFDGLEYHLQAGTEYVLNFTRKQFIKDKAIDSFTPKGVVVKSSEESMVPWRIPFYDRRFMPLSEYWPAEVEFKRPEITLNRMKKTDTNKIDWGSARTVNDLLRHDTGEIPAQRTTVQITYDDYNLYVRYLCFESLMDELAVRNTKPDWPEWDEWGSYRSPDKYQVWDDAVGLYLMPGFDEEDQYHHPYYLIFVNAKGISYDAFYDEYGIFYKSWNSNVKSKIRIKKDHWVAELTIPFSSFELNPRNTTNWGLNLIRRRPEKSDTGPIRVNNWSLGSRKMDMDVEYEGGYEITCWSPTYGHIRNPIRMGVANGVNSDLRQHFKTYYLSKISELHQIISMIENNDKYQTTIKSLRADLTYIEKNMRNMSIDKVDNLYRSLRMKINTWNNWIHSKRIPQVSSTDRRLIDVHFVDKNYGWIAGAAGVILHTKDGGGSWEVQESGTDYELEGIFFTDQRTGWAVGGNIRPPRKENFIDRDVGAMGIILHTKDGGRTWLPQLMGDARWLYDVTFVDDKTGWAVGEFGLVLATVDGGDTWQVQPSGSLKWLNEVCFIDKNHGWIACEDEQVLQTADGGKHWNKINTPEHRDTNEWPGVLNTVYFVNDKIGWTAGRNGNLFKTENGGKRWHVQKIPFEKDIRELAEFQDIFFIDENKGWAVSCLGDIIFQTKDGGEIWNICHTGNRNWLHAIFFTDDKTGWAVGERGTILKTTDGGSSWHMQRSDGDELDVLVFHAHSDDELSVSYLTAYYADQGYKVGYIRYTINDLSTYRLGELRTQEYRATSAYLGGVVNRTIYQCINAGRQGFPMPYMYQKWGGWESSERWMVAAIRALKPKIIITQETAFDKVSHSVGSYMVVNAIKAAGEKDKYPRLKNIGLDEWQTPKIYFMVSPRLFENSYNPWPKTLGMDSLLSKISPRIGITYRELAIQAFRYCQSQGGYKGVYSTIDTNAEDLHLYKSNIKSPEDEKTIFDGIKFLQRGMNVIIQH